MRFKSTQVTGKGRGKLLGYPTINLEIPDKFSLRDGIYAVRVLIGNRRFAGALHYGPIPVFNEINNTLEVFLIDTKNSDIPDDQNLEIEIIQYLRQILNFPNQEELVKQIGKDVKDSKKILNL